MTTAKTEIEHMQARLDQISSREQLLIRALDQALADADRKLLDDVRSVAIEHEARRSVILTELHTLASRIGAFPAVESPVGRIEYESIDLPTYELPENLEPIDDRPRGGDWRKAAENIPDHLDHDFDGSGDDVEMPRAKRRA